MARGISRVYSSFDFNLTPVLRLRWISDECEMWATYISTCTYRAIRNIQQFLFIIFFVSFLAVLTHEIYIYYSWKNLHSSFCCYFSLLYILFYFSTVWTAKTWRFLWMRWLPFSSKPLLLVYRHQPLITFVIPLTRFFLFLFIPVMYVKSVYIQIFSGHGRNCSTDYDLQIKN